MPSAVEGEGQQCVPTANVGGKHNSFLGTILISLDLISKWESTYLFIGSSLLVKR
jgi:hypothetical protein